MGKWSTTHIKMIIWIIGKSAAGKTVIGQELNKLIKNGMSKKTDIAAINWGTYSKQKTVLGNLENIFEKIKSNSIKSPSIIIIGEICKLRAKLNWFENKPLFGKNIIVTRARKNASILSKKIASLGGNPIEIPTIDGGKAKIKIPDGTQSGKQFRLKGKGMPYMKGSGNGDLYVQITTEVPISLNKAQKELLEKFREIENEKSNPSIKKFFQKAKSFWKN